MSSAKSAMYRIERKTPQPVHAECCIEKKASPPVHAECHTERKASPPVHAECRTDKKASPPLTAHCHTQTGASRPTRRPLDTISEVRNGGSLLEKRGRGVSRTSKNKYVTT